MAPELSTIMTLLITAILLANPLAAAEGVRRAKPPEWSQDVLDTFFVDARQQLVGERPQATQSIAKFDPKPSASAEQQPIGEILVWSKLIAAETLTSEVKRIHLGLAALLKNAGTFKSGGNLQCRRDLSLLATVFGVIAEYDADVRWKNSARLMQSKCLQVAANCKAASDQSFAAATQVRVVLEDLIRGQSLVGKTPSKEVRVADRTQLMQRMELSLEERISPALANLRDFRKRSKEIDYESQMLAMLAQVIQREPYEYHDDDTFLEYARQLREASRELSRTSRVENYKAARAASGMASQSCSACHEGYRG